MLRITSILNEINDHLTLARLYLDLNGPMYDPVRGYECYMDLINTIANFIPEEQIHTDYIKMLHDLTLKAKNQNDQTI